jgi:lactoylglutathione lyase
MRAQPRAIPVARIERFALRVQDLERMRRFYEHYLGAVASPLAMDPVSGLRSCLLDFCGVCVDLIAQAVGPRGERPGGFPRIAFALGSADAVDELSLRLAADGYRVLEAPHRSPDGSYRSAVLDPDGNPIALTV